MPPTQPTSRPFSNFRRRQPSRHASPPPPPQPPVSSPLLRGLVLVLAISVYSSTATGQPMPTPNVPWNNDAIFELDPLVSDEFNQKPLDRNKWDENGIRQANTNCPTWNGPPSTIADPLYSTFFPAAEHPTKPAKRYREYRVRGGSLQMRIKSKALKFFQKREYFCDATTFTCNHNPDIPCFWTNFFGEPVYTDATNTTYAGITHDKCKISPFCIPHFEKVEGKTERTYTRYSSSHITGKNLFKYGYVETRVKLAASSAVFAVWMHARNSTGPGFCRFRRAEGFAAGVRRECPSSIRSDRWQEIDLVEAMNSVIHKQRYIPNIHLFSGTKGEYTSASSVDDGSGNMGGGPIVVTDSIFNQFGNLFGSLPAEDKAGNEFHWNPGSILNLTDAWADRWHVMGVYWSATEIRLYVEGVEVFRMQNDIIHQPMAIDVSNTINAGWSQEIPTDQEVAQWGQVDYVRVWSVFTPDGNDPVSTLEMNNAQGRKFQDSFGSNMYDVFDRYPHNDDVTLLPVTPTEAGKSPASFRAPLVGGNGERLAGEDGRITNWMPVPPDQGAANFNGGVRVMTDDDDDDDDIGDDLADRQGKNGGGRRSRWRQRGFKPAGGRRRKRMRRIDTKLNRFHEAVAMSRPDRAAKVIVNSKGEVQGFETLAQGGQSAFDIFDPSIPGSGFSTKNGDGLSADLVQ